MHPDFAPEQQILMKGYVTKALFLRQQPAPELERRLGYASGRLAQGWWPLFLERMPTPDDFEFRGYSQMSGGIAQGHLRKGPTAEQELISGRFDVASMKRRIILQNFRLSGPDRLAKVVPIDGPTGTMPYPPGSGVPQWELTRPMTFRVWGRVDSGEVYSGDYS